MKRLFFLCLCALLMSCQVEDSISRNYRCYFIFDTSLHPLPCQLTAILGNPGHFCMIEGDMYGGVRRLKTTRNYDGNKEDILLRTEKESQISYAFGANNCIIIGTSSYENRLVAYDGQCPNCLKEHNDTNYPLTWQKSGLHHQRRCRHPTLCLHGSLRRHPPPRLELK